MDELMDLYRKTIMKESNMIDSTILKKHNLSEDKWSSFLTLVQDLELNEEGVRIMLDEIQSGRFVIN